MGEWGHEPETLELASAGLGTSGRVGSSKRQGARDDSGAGFEDTWSSHSIRMTVGCLVAPRPPLPHDPWLCGALGAEGGSGSGPRVCSVLCPWPGSYNNQWMIVDYKAFVPGGPSPGSRVLTILEQLP